jgi:hypothetical protein
MPLLELGNYARGLDRTPLPNLGSEKNDRSLPGFSTMARVGMLRSLRTPISPEQFVEINSDLWKLIPASVALYNLQQHVFLS